MKLALLVLGTVAIAAPSVAAPATANGEMLFRQRCQVCHSVAATGAVGMGPNLKAVVGRKAGATMFAYSSALKQSKLVWTAATLDRFLTAPTQMVPGTRMVISVPDPAQRAAVIQYLISAR
jgi:cytochrome c